jgi:Mannosyl-glycoprotein endo-beta-N-acetylglucosaminidase
MGAHMGKRFGFAVGAVLAGIASPALAERLPPVKLSAANQPPACTTPGRLMAFIKARNPRLQAKFRNIAADYMRHGQDLGIRWDYAFYQMVLETNSLKYTGDVGSRQNNFAGLGATGGGVKGESFRSVSDGVRAHQQHLMIYAGIYVTDPVADRTRKVQSWGILDKWRKRFGRPITFGDVGSKWAPVDRQYGADIQAIANAFYGSHCKRPDPDANSFVTASGTRKPNYNARKRAGLGASSTINRNPPASYKTLNSSANRIPTNPPAKKNNQAVAKFAVPNIQPPAAQNKCRVWTASYGGQKAIIIRSIADRTTNYTVLDVNPGREEAETKAYIAAYAKGGKRIDTFPSKTAAMAKAFKLCPEK